MAASELVSTQSLEGHSNILDGFRKKLHFKYLAGF